MDPSHAVQYLHQLRDEITNEGTQGANLTDAAWTAKVEAVLTAVLDSDSPTLRAFRATKPIGAGWEKTPRALEERQRLIAEQAQKAGALVDTAIFEIEAINHPKAAEPPPNERTIFVVHGRDEVVKYRLVRTLERCVSLPVTILHEMPNRGTTIIEKLERHARDAAFAVVIITGDDEGRLKADTSKGLRDRGRQNVVFEAGVFMGALGRSKVAILLEEGVEQPTDLNGVLYIPIDPAGAWQHKLLQELASAEIGVDFTRLP